MQPHDDLIDTIVSLLRLTDALDQGKSPSRILDLCHMFHVRFHNDRPHADQLRLLNSRLWKEAFENPQPRLQRLGRGRYAIIRDHDGPLQAHPAHLERDRDPRAVRPDA